MNEGLPRRKLRMALIGGGGNAFIGRVHALAACLDGRAELVAGALSSNPERARASAADFRIADDRAYESCEQLFDEEKQLSADERIDFVSIATPNFTHYKIAQQALNAGFHVLCDKPLTTNEADAVTLAETVRSTGRVFGLMHNYSGYPMVRQARQMIVEGELGTIQAVRVRYIQGWMRGLTPDIVPARGAWKDDPQKAGPSGTMADVGTHAYQLARFVSRLEPQSVTCQLRTYSPGRVLDDYGHALVRCRDDALIAVSVSQVTHGRLNDLELEVDGTTGAISWRQEAPNQLTLRRFGQPTMTLERNPNASYTEQLAKDSCRLPAGHPEAFLEAFANVYGDFFDAVHRSESGGFDPTADVVFPTVSDGVEGVRFVERCVASNNDDGRWQNFACESIT